MLFGSIGLGSTTTLISALASKDKSSNTLVSMLSIPLLLPLLIVLVKGSLGFCTPASTTGWTEIKLAAIYAFMMTAISVTIFPKFWEEGRS
jgi:heme exporter protein B